MKLITLFLVLGLTACAGENGRDGSNGVDGTPGLDGAPGQDGSDGQDGEDGAPGVQGPQGPAGEDVPPTPYTPVGLVNPCGDAPGIADEIFIKMTNGQLVASYSQNANGDNTRFVVLTPGTYVTTDGDNCQFTVNADGSLSNESKGY